MKASMNYEKFNDAMIRLRQAEENLNMALRDIYVAINQADSRRNEPIYGTELEEREDQS